MWLCEWVSRILVGLLSVIICSSWYIYYRCLLAININLLVSSITIDINGYVSINVDGYSVAIEQGVHVVVIHHLSRRWLVGQKS
jgi:hypothetical protein